MTVKLDFPLPEEDGFFFFQQAGVFIYENDDKYVRLDHVAIFNTRQIEFAKEKPSPAEGFEGPPRQRKFGGTVLDNPERITWLRIVARTNPTTGVQTYTAYSSVDGVRYDRGGAWTFGATNNAGDSPMVNRKIGISAFGGVSGDQQFFDADFDFVRVTQP